MPEYPDIELYLNAFQHHICGLPLTGVIVRSPFLLRTFEIDVASACSMTVNSVFRMGKQLVWELAPDNNQCLSESCDNLFLVFHLMISGRFHKRKQDSLPKSKMDLAAFQFDPFTLMLTEAAPKKRASLHVIRGRAGLGQFDRSAMDVTTCTSSQFAQQIRSQNRTVKISLIDPNTFDGIGNAYSDEILHAARMSPFTRTGSMSDEQVQALHQAAKSTLGEWRDRLIEQTGDNFPERVTAFRPEMAVHGKFGEPCPVCEMKVQRIVFSEKEWNYCAGCQTGGKLLADRSLSRLLRDEWPKSLE